MAEHVEYVTDAKNRKNLSNQLMVTNALDDDVTVIRLSPATMNKLDLFCGDTVKLKGNKRRETICHVFLDDTCQDDCVRVHYVIQNNLRVCSKDKISIEGFPNVKYGIRIHVLPIIDVMTEMPNNLLEDYLRQYFQNAYRPVSVDDRLVIQNEGRTIEFQVIETEPSPCCIVASETIINCEGEPILRTTDDDFWNRLTFDDIGGLKDIKQTLKECVQHSIDHEILFQRFGMAPSRGFLLYGPSSCGKTMLIKALANECDLNFVSINCMELLNTSYGSMEENITSVFEKVSRMSPCIVFIDQLDYACKAIDKCTSDETILASRLINCLLTEIDGMNLKKKVFVFGETNQPYTIDRTLLRPGRLDQMIYIPLPDENTREEILKIALRQWSIAPDVDLRFLAKILSGSSSADVTQFCQRTIKSLIRELIEEEQRLKLENSCRTSNTTNSSEKEIRRDHFDRAMKDRRHTTISDSISQQYDNFTKMLQSYYGYNLSWHAFHFPENMNEYAGNLHQQSSTYTDDDDLYS